MEGELPSHVKSAVILPKIASLLLSKRTLRPMMARSVASGVAVRRRRGSRYFETDCSSRFMISNEVRLSEETRKLVRHGIRGFPIAELPGPAMNQAPDDL